MRYLVEYEQQRPDGELGLASVVVEASSAETAEQQVIDRYADRVLGEALVVSVTAMDAPAAIVPDRLYTIAEVQAALQCSQRQVYQHMTEGMPYAKVGGGRRVLGSDLLAFARGARVRPPRAR